MGTRDDSAGREDAGLLSDAELAARLAAAAGRLLTGVRAAGLLAGDALGRAGDQVANQFLVHGLRALRPDDGLLSEELACDGARLARSRVWIVDPVDGTREYGEGRDDWAVHVGLAVDGVARVGAVALPGLDGGVLLRSDRPGPLPPPPATPRIVVSRNRPGAQAEAVARALGGRLVPMGSAGAKAMAVVRGQAEIYLHSGGQYEWDSLAPVAVAQGWGLHCSRIDGAPLRYNRRDVFLPDLLICRADLASRVLAALAGSPNG
jgi:3'(2'), 5'-bisphosphate nucleotidase